MIYSANRALVFQTTKITSLKKKFIDAFEHVHLKLKISSKNLEEHTRRLEDGDSKIRGKLMEHPLFTLYYLLLLLALTLFSALCLFLVLMHREVRRSVGKVNNDAWRRGLSPNHALSHR